MLSKAEQSLRRMPRLCALGNSVYPVSRSMTSLKTFNCVKVWLLAINLTLNFAINMTLNLAINLTLNLAINLTLNLAVNLTPWLRII